MSPAAHLAARLAVLGLVVVLLQITAVSQFPVAGGVADLAPLVVMAVALMAGALTGACFGFGVGLLLDVALLQTLGVSSLILLGVGYGCGRLREARDLSSALVPLAAGALATFAAAVGFALVEFMLDVGAPVGAVLVRQLLATLVLNALLALPIYAAARRWLLPALPEDPRRRRRRAATAGVPSPISRMP